MSRKVLIACKMVEAELRGLLSEIDFEGEIVWMDKGLHESPEKLRSALQQEVDQWDAPDTYMMLAYGLCGNGALGLVARKGHLVIPKFDDCLRVMLSEGPGNPITYNPHALLYTEGWMDLEDSLLSGQHKYIKQYGEKKGMKVLRLMFKNYEEVQFLDTGNYDIEAAKDKVRPTVDALGLNFSTRKIKLTAYMKFLKGEWDSEFIVTDPGETVTEEHFADRARCLFD